MKLFISGRKKTFQKLSTLKKSDQKIWFHVASLGEFEQAMPIIEAVKRNYQDYKIIVTFFSPSGYEIRKNSNLADLVCYLPFDTKANMKRFVEEVHPEIAIIVKYEFWPNLLGELKKQSIPDIKILEEQLSNTLGSPVALQHNANGKGRLILKYNTLEELDGILEHIK